MTPGLDFRVRAMAYRRGGEEERGRKGYWLMQRPWCVTAAQLTQHADAVETGEMDEHVRAPTALPEHPGLVSSTHIKGDHNLL